MAAMEVLVKHKLEAGKRSGIYIGVITLILSAFLAGRLHGATGSVSDTAKCKTYVPAEWGEYVGSSQYGIVFKDNEGTLRFFRGVPCGHEGTPVIDVEIRRK
jgi:hypothetical protein